MSSLHRAVVEVSGEVVGDLVVPGRPEPAVFMYGAEVPESSAVSVTMPVAGQVYSYRSEEHTSELQSRPHLVCRLLLEKKKTTTSTTTYDYHKTFCFCRRSLACRRGLSRRPNRR